MLSGDVCERHERTLVKVKICVARQCNRVKIDETLLPTAASTSNKECTRAGYIVYCSSTKAAFTNTTRWVRRSSQEKGNELFPESGRLSKHTDSISLW
jgi:hypothetical protein